MTRLTKQKDNSPLPIIALLTGAGIWGIIWYPYRLLEQAGISGEVSTTIAYFFALLLGLILFHKSIRTSLIFNGEALLLLWIALFAIRTDVYTSKSGNCYFIVQAGRSRHNRLFSG